MLKPRRLTKVVKGLALFAFEEPNEKWPLLDCISVRSETVLEATNGHIACTVTVTDGHGFPAGEYQPENLLARIKDANEPLVLVKSMVENWTWPNFAEVFPAYRPDDAPVGEDTSRCSGVMRLNAGYLFRVGEGLRTIGDVELCAVRFQFNEPMSPARFDLETGDKAVSATAIVMPMRRAAPKGA